MKKVFLTAFVAAAFAFGMTACNNNNANEEVIDSACETECCEHHCDHQCAHECTCEDTTCAANNCETCVNKGTENCCKAKAGEQPCCAHQHEGCCEHQHEGCEHACQHHAE
ncbi:MAG: hypothetical protein MJZ67_02445 [Bacteroidales bacterium]|nr:hypothetical protein [Bacteroidales bacterium]